MVVFSVFFNDTATTETYTYWHTLSLHHALPILKAPEAPAALSAQIVRFVQKLRGMDLFKLPGVAETIDWAHALTQLDCMNRSIPRSFRSEEHTSELQPLMRISYAVFCLKKKKKTQPNKYTETSTQAH